VVGDENHPLSLAGKGQMEFHRGSAATVLKCGLTNGKPFQRVLVFLTAIVSSGFAGLAHPDVPLHWQIDIQARDFSSFYVPGVDAVRQAPLGAEGVGLAGGRDKPVTGWFDYQFSVPGTGWYEILARGNDVGIEYILDPALDETSRAAFRLYSVRLNRPGGKVGNLWLTEGRHTLRLQRYFWTGFPPLQGITIRASGDGLPASVYATILGSETVFRAKQCPVLRLYSGARRLSDKVTIIVDDATSHERRARIVVPVRASSQLVGTDVSLPCNQEGEYQVALGDADGKALDGLGSGDIRYAVIGTAPVPNPGAPLRGTLVQEIDCTKIAPDYASSSTRVVSKPFGSYRESAQGDWFRYQSIPASVRQLASSPGWFAYRLNVADIQQPYYVEVLYPDDTDRSFVVALRERDSLSLSVAAGIDSGREFSLSNEMAIFRLVYWPRSTSTRIVLMATKDGRPAAASKIRLYKVDGGFPALTKSTAGGRRFANFFEEGANYRSVYGAPDEGDRGTRVATDRWAQAVAYAGGDTLIGAVNIYNFVMYPSRYNRVFSSTWNLDVVRETLLICEKYGLKFLPDLHPRADELMWPYANATDPKPNLLVSKDGATNMYSPDGKRRNVPPHYNPLYPANQEWYLGMIGELADRYRDSPALLGVNLRLMQWQNPTLNNFHSLDWGYDDYTVGLFQKETGIVVPGASEDPRRFQQRYEWLMAHAKDDWIAWRCKKITEIYVRILGRLRQARPDLQLYTTAFDIYPSGYGVAWLREAGIDLQQLARIKGIVLINALHAYGRRYDDLTTQAARDNLLDPEILGSMVSSGDNGKFLAYARYFEASPGTFPAEPLGFDANTKATWISAAVNPAGRHMLERYAVELAETDASLLGDGGNNYTLGQPVLGEFMREYRALPATPFVRREDARDPVAVWQLSTTSGLLFYAVNRERYAVDLRVKFSGNGTVSRLSTGAGVLLKNGVIDVHLAPYELMAFRAMPGMNISSIETQVPEAERSLVERQVSWLEGVARDNPPSAMVSRLSGPQRTTIQSLARTARSALDKKWFWRARTVLERHELLPIYELLSSCPPQLRSSQAAGHCW
jgi:hypothetical protein